jgi:phosphoribosylformimino-5-aminoimidazole carboxamide ribotide isomerase
VIATFAALPLAGVLVTAVHREGLLAGTDQALMADLARVSPHPLIASGGIVSLDDLRALGAAGVAAAVVGTALYTGALDARALIEEFE